MKYTQYSRKRQGSSAFYIVTALCLVLVGVAAWFAVSRMNKADNIERKTSSIESKLESNFENNDNNSDNNLIDDFESDIDEYKDDFESYTEDVPDDIEENPSSSNPENNNASSKPNNDPSSNDQAGAQAEKVKAFSMPLNGEILKDFSTTALQYSATYNDMRIHAAIDIAAEEGTLIGACADGVVTDIEESSDYGKCVTIDHGDGLVIKYAGLKNVTAEKDTSVRIGDNIGAVGTVPCECADQSHLHIEAYDDGRAISILTFFS